VSQTKQTTKPSGTLNFVLDFGPLLLFFVASKLGSSDTDPKQGAIVGTAAFMAAIIVAVIVSKLKLGKISPMLKLTAALGVFFGALTIWFHDERFIQIKPTIIYAFFAALLLGGWLRGKAMLK
jgi:intracellular septation protein